MISDVQAEPPFVLEKMTPVLGPAPTAMHGVAEVHDTPSRYTKPPVMVGTAQVVPL